MFNNCRGAWSVHRPDYVALEVMNLLNRKELLIGKKESHPALTCCLSQKSSASSEPYEFVFFSEKLNFSPLVRLHSKLPFCFSPPPAVTYCLITSNHGNPWISLDSLFDGFADP
ncbi:uncharacterized protein TNCV_3766661 [Trichonephila clavipes]|nr:uncharacterized protein TNCV_3766661 [Trichonephila clavipes]